MKRLTIFETRIEKHYAYKKKPFMNAYQARKINEIRNVIFDYQL